MNTIKESILGSVGAGKAAIEKEIQQWIDETIFGNEPRNPQFHLTAEVVGNGIVFHSDKPSRLSSKVSIYNFALQSPLYNLDWHFTKFVDSRGILMDVDFLNCTVTDNIMPDEVLTEVVFIGCEINCNHLPKGCDSVTFDVQHSLAGAHGCHLVCDWKNITLKNVHVGYTAKGVSGLSSLSHFQNCTFTSDFYITDNMLGYYSYDSKHRCLTEQAETLLKGFLKHNKVDINKIIFRMPADSKHFGEVASLVYDKKTDNFKVKK